MKKITNSSIKRIAASRIEKRFT